MSDYTDLIKQLRLLIAKELLSALDESASKRTSENEYIKPIKTAWFFTTAANHPGGAGYWHVEAGSAEEARAKMIEYFGTEWAFQYATWEELHPLDRKKIHGIIF